MKRTIYSISSAFALFIVLGLIVITQYGCGVDLMSSVEHDCDSIIFFLKSIPIAGLAGSIKYFFVYPVVIFIIFFTVQNNNSNTSIPSIGIQEKNNFLHTFDRTIRWTIIFLPILIILGVFAYFAWVFHQ